jgi:catechol 2,3-dioxygenase-like lactoylglutathione lyase family enzyme
MAVQLNHTIVWCHDNKVAADFFTDLFGLPPAEAWGPFRTVEMANGVSLDYHAVEGDIPSQHYAFLVSDDEFDQIFGRIQAQQLTYWADPMLSQEGEINHNDGGRGVYWQDVDGHLLEIITVPYGGWR